MNPFDYSYQEASALITKIKHKYGDKHIEGLFLDEAAECLREIDSSGTPLKYYKGYREFYDMFRHANPGWSDDNKAFLGQMNCINKLLWDLALERRQNKL